jgi:hypothetical protein
MWNLNLVQDSALGKQQHCDGDTVHPVVNEFGLGKLSKMATAKLPSGIKTAWCR